MGELYKNKKTGKTSELPPYKCRVCGLGNIEHSFGICSTCGWEDDDLQNDEPDYEGGANHMSLNQYKEFWEKNKEKIMNSTNTCFAAIDLAKKYYKEYFEKK